jgi:hypothetical protein
MRSGAAEFPHTPFRRALAPPAAGSEKNADGFRANEVGAPPF